MTEEEVIQDVISKTKMPKEVLSVDFSFTEDSTGMPSVRINLHVFDDLHPSASKIRKLSKLMRNISRQILDANIPSWPYVHLVTD